MSATFEYSIRTFYSTAYFRVTSGPELILENGSAYPCHVIGIDQLRAIAENILKMLEYYESKRTIETGNQGKD